MYINFMLSLFPQLFTYRELAPFILRIAVGLVIIGFNYRAIFHPEDRKNFFFGLLALGAGVSLLAGFLTQPAAAVLLALLIYFAIARRKSPAPGFWGFAAILLAGLVSLMFLGPGFFSVDLPL